MAFENWNLLTYLLVPTTKAGCHNVRIFFTSIRDPQHRRVVVGPALVAGGNGVIRPWTSRSSRIGLGSCHSPVSARPDIYSSHARSVAVLCGAKSRSNWIRRTRPVRPSTLVRGQEQSQRAWGVLAMTPTADHATVDNHLFCSRLWFDECRDYTGWTVFNAQHMLTV